MRRILFGVCCVLTACAHEARVPAASRDPVSRDATTAAQAHDALRAELYQAVARAEAVGDMAGARAAMRRLRKLERYTAAARQP